MLRVDDGFFLLIMEKLGIDPILIITQIINFLLLLFILRRLLYQPLLNIIEKRKQQAQAIEKTRLEVDELKNRMQKDQEKIIKSAKHEAERIIAQSQQQADKLKTRMENEAQEKVNAMLKRGERELNAQQKKMRTEAKEEIAQFSVKIAERVLTANLTSEQRSEFLQQAIDGFSQAEHT